MQDKTIKLNQFLSYSSYAFFFKKQITFQLEMVGYIQIHRIPPTREVCHGQRMSDKRTIVKQRKFAENFMIITVGGGGSMAEGQRG